MISELEYYKLIKIISLNSTEFNEIRDNLLKLVLLLDKFEYDELTRKDILDSNLEYELKTFSFIAA